MPNKQRLKEQAAKTPNNMAEYIAVKNIITYTPSGFDGETGESFRMLNGEKISEKDFLKLYRLPSVFLSNPKGLNPDKTRF